MLTLQIDLHMPLLVSLGTTAIGYGIDCRSNTGNLLSYCITLVYTYKLALVTLQTFPPSLLLLSVPCNLSIRVVYTTEITHMCSCKSYYVITQK